MKYWGKMGALWGGFWGLLFGAAFFWVPGVGPLLVAGPVSAAIVAALESAVVVGGVSVLGAALYSIGIPKDSVLRYETAIKVNKYLLVAHGTAAEVARAKDILKTTKPAQLDEHDLGDCQVSGGLMLKKSGEISFKEARRAEASPEAHLNSNNP